MMRIKMNLEKLRLGETMKVTASYQPEPPSTALYETKWMELRETDNDGYTWGRMVKGDGVSVLGYNDEGEYLARIEYTPSHSKQFKRTALTGTIEDGLTPSQTAVKELKEESGYVAKENEFKYLGWAWPSKFLDYKQHYFAIDLTGKEQGEIIGDGSSGEEGASVEWVSLDEALAITDTSVAAMIAKLKLGETG